MVLDTISDVQNFVDVFIYIYILVIFVLIVLSLLPRLPYAFNPVLRFVHDVCDPYLNIFRRFLPPLGPLDLSPLVGIVVLVVLEDVLNSLLGRLH